MTSKKYDFQWLQSFITDGMQMVKNNDSLAVKIFNDYYRVVHPDFSSLLTADEVESIIKYLTTKPKLKK
jgi:hypothetical protein